MIPRTDADVPSRELPLKRQAHWVRHCQPRLRKTYAIAQAMHSINLAPIH